MGVVHPSGLYTFIMCMYHTCQINISFVPLSLLRRPKSKTSQGISINLDVIGFFLITDRFVFHKDKTISILYSNGTEKF
jgi:hypothetical protein